MQPLNQDASTKFIKDLETFSVSKNLSILQKELEPFLTQAVRQIGARSLFSTDEAFETHLEKIHERLHLISKRITEISHTSDANNFAAKVQGIAQGILPPKEELKLPTEIWGEVFSHLEYEDYAENNILTISHFTKDEAKLQKKEWVETYCVSPRVYGADTAKKAIKAIIDLKLSVANLRDYPDLTVDHLKSLIEARADLKILILPPHLTSLPAEIGNLTQLEELDLQMGQFTHLPADIGKLTNLKRLYLVGSQLVRLPPEIGNLIKLEKLTGQFTYTLTHLPAEIGKLKNLRVFDFQASGLVGLPTEFGNLTKLEVLNLNYVKLTHFPLEVLKLKNLRLLNLDRSQIDILPPEIGNLTHLEYLSLEENKFTYLPTEIGNLINLKELNLFNNPLDRLPAEIGNLTKLEVLQLDCSKLTHLPAEVGNLINLRRLSITNSSLMELPQEIGTLENLERIDLSQSGQLIRLPEEFFQLQNLKFLDLANTPLGNYPEIYFFKKLETLICNPKMLLTREITNLIHLRELFLQKSENCDLPDEIGSLAELETLDLSDSKISALPPTMDQLKNLQNLHCYAAPIKILPAAIAGLESLVELDINKTLILNIPPELCKLKKLKRVWFNNKTIDFQKQIAAAESLAGAIPEFIGVSLSQIANLSEIQVKNLIEISERTDLAELPHSEILLLANQVLELLGMDPEESPLEPWIRELELS